MDTNFTQGSARIYQFPAGGRAALGGKRYDQSKQALEQAPRFNEAACADSWYHQEAILEAERGRDH